MGGRGQLYPLVKNTPTKNIVLIKKTTSGLPEKDQVKKGAEECSMIIKSKDFGMRHICESESSAHKMSTWASVKWG